MKEQLLVEMKNKIDNLDLILRKVITELTHLGDLSVGTLETLKKMPGYKDAILKLKEKSISKLKNKKL